MKIERFQCTNLNSYLDFDLHLEGNVSFLIGINGSGKTSVLKAIMALLGPDVDWLMNAKYQHISVSLLHDEKTISISATRSDVGMLFEYIENGNSQPFTLLEAAYKGSIQKSEDYVHNEDGELIRIRETRSELPDNILPIQSVRRLPTPIFLGLDRTSLPTGPNARTRQRRYGQPRTTHASLRTFLDESVGQADLLATEAVRQAHLIRARRAASLREQILLSLFSEDSGGDNDVVLPRQQDIRRYEKARKSLKAAFSILGIDADHVDSSIDPFFSNVIGLATSLSKHKSLDEVISAKADSDLRRDFYGWMATRPRLALIEQVDGFVTNFNESEAQIFRHINKYLGIMNSFLEDSNKKLSFREDNTLQVKLPSNAAADVYYLSSGERQLFVLITTLMFSDEQRRANTVIIDEPELSLHIKWQEMFVDSLMQANPDIQLILATHSPSIILDRDDACVELS